VILMRGPAIIIKKKSRELLEAEGGGEGGGEGAN
jgi:hypothetical protein